MEMTPSSIQQKRFHDSFRGYDHEEVDVFLDEVADAFDAIYRENQETRIKIKRLEERLVEAEGTEDMLKRTLLAAQRTADDAVEEARAKAQEILEAAKAEASEIVAEAQNQGREIVTGARTEAESASQRADELKNFEAEYRAKLRQVIEGHLEELTAKPLSRRPAPRKAETEAPRPDVQTSDETGETGAPEPEASRGTPSPMAKPARHSIAATAPEAAAGPEVGGERSESRPEEPSSDENAVYLDEDADEDRTITELFWGED